MVFVSLPFAANAAGKIAVLNVQEAIMKTNKAQSEFKALRKKSSFSNNLSKLERLKKEHDDAIKKLQKDMAMMSTEQKKSEGKKIQEKRADVEHIMRKLQASEQEIVQKLMQELGPKLQKTVNEIIKQEKIGLLIDRKAVMHMEDSFDITKKVTAKLNKS